MNEFIFPETGEIVNETDLRRKYDNISIAAVIGPDACALLGVSPILHSPQPTPGQYQSVIRNGAVQDAGGNWIQAWSLVDWDATQITEANTIATNYFVSMVSNRVQDRLDSFAKTRNYDGVLSACSYATSTIAKFQAEAQYCVVSRDNTWNKLYQIMSDVQNGIRPMPTSYAEIELELPTLTWPV